MVYTSLQLKNLAKKNPQEFIKIITNLDAKDITTLVLGVEILGEEITEEVLVLPILRRSLKHIHSLVREAAISGVSCFYTDKKPPQDIMDRLKEISINDPSPVLREYGKDLLEDFS